jgi:hypothetical protein
MDFKATIALWLFVINLGIACGAGFYEHRIVVARWITTSPETGAHWNADAARQDDTGRRFWAWATTVPLTSLTLLNLYLSWHATGAVRGWWLAAGTAALADRALTFSYFIPVMMGLMGASDSTETAALATRWSTFNYARHALVLAAWLAALRAFALIHER